MPSKPWLSLCFLSIALTVCPTFMTRNSSDTDVAATGNMCDMKKRKEVSYLVGWCFEPRQPQRIISGLKTKLQSSSQLFNLRVTKQQQQQQQQQQQKHTIQPTSYLTEHTNLSRKDKIIFTISERKPRETITHVLEPIYNPPALNSGTCINCL